jgi:multimeric flavodoxin WrbA
MWKNLKYSCTEFSDMSNSRVLIVAASPRKESNSTILALKAAEGVEAAEGIVDIVKLGELSIAPCTACDACRITPEANCVIDDDMQFLYEKLRQADGVIFASPVYWFNVSAQLKLFIDRTYGMRRGDTHGLTAKHIGVILTYADRDIYESGGVNALRSFQDICGYVKADLVGMVYGSTGSIGAVKDNEELLRRAYELGKSMANP